MLKSTLCPVLKRSFKRSGTLCRLGNVNFCSLRGAVPTTKPSSCKIVVLGPKCGDDALKELASLPSEAEIVATGTTLDEIRKDGGLHTQANVILNVTGNKAIIPDIINEMPSLVWIHSITAGVDHLMCPEIANNPDIILTNAKGVFSSSLAEYVMGACSYFAKNIPRLKHQQREHKWDPFCVTELRGQTMGIVGLGDIGTACAKLAKAYGMKVVALRRNPFLSKSNPLIDEVYGNDGLHTVMAKSDYLVVCMALTESTRGMIDSTALSHAKPGQVFINIGRGALIDEAAVISALKKANENYDLSLADGSTAALLPSGIVAAALDVFTVEPLPHNSELWDLPNLLLSPHNADILVDSRHSSVRTFTEYVKTFVAGNGVGDCIVDKSAGY